MMSTLSRRLLPLPALLALLLLHATFALALALASVHLPSPDDFVNHSLTTQLDLAGSVSHLTTTVSFQQSPSIRNVSARDGTLFYYLLLDSNTSDALSYSRALIKPAPDSALAQSQSQSQSQSASSARPRPDLELEVISLGPLADDNSTHIYSVSVPYAALGTSPATLTFEATLNHLTTPLPATIKQTEPQLLLWRGDAHIRSPYPTNTARIKVKTSHPRILSYQPATATKSGSTLTFGPYHNVPAYTAPPDPSNLPPQAQVHFQHDLPLVSLVNVDRVAEVSHWGDNLAIQDRIWLRNDGARLKGHFSRIEHQMSAFYRKSSAHALTNLAMHLPPGAKDAYFVDQIGNVSTSHFRGAPSSPSILHVPLNQVPSSRASFLEIQPRFPLVGGWNYTFSIGWNMPLSAGGWLRAPHPVSGSGSREYVLAVPFLTPITDVAVDQVTTRIVLPEGAILHHLALPFDVDEHRVETHKTYLDTHGRPTILLARARCSEKHGQLVYIKYSLSPLAHLRKPLAVGTIALAAFVLAAIVRRMQFSI